MGSGEKTTIRQLATLISEIYNAPAPEVNGAFRNGDVRAASGDITRTREELGWEPQWSVERGVRELCAWIDQTDAS
nr:GDP-mannose 4,6-dehydratase [Paraburkholderia sp. BL8N3]